MEGEEEEQEEEVEVEVKVEEQEKEVVEVKVACECCGFTEECTRPYIAGVRARYVGWWICGLCGAAVGEDLGRAFPPISPAEALDRHACVCRGASAPPSPAGSPDVLIAAVLLLLRRSLRSAPSISVVATRAAGSSLGRMEMSSFHALDE